MSRLIQKALFTPTYLESILVKSSNDLKDKKAGEIEKNKTKQNKTKTERTKRHATETPEKVAKLYDLRHRIRMSPLRYQEGFRTGPVLPNRDLKL